MGNNTSNKTKPIEVLKEKDVNKSDNFKYGLVNYSKDGHSEFVMNINQSYEFEIVSWNESNDCHGWYWDNKFIMKGNWKFDEDLKTIIFNVIEYTCYLDGKEKDVSHINVNEFKSWQISPFSFGDKEMRFPIMPWNNLKEENLEMRFFPRLNLTI